MGSNSIALLNSQCGHGEVAEPVGYPGQGALVKDVPVDLGAGEAGGEAGVRRQGDADGADPEGGPHGADGETGGGGPVKVSEGGEEQGVRGLACCSCVVCSYYVVICNDILALALDD